MRQEFPHALVRQAYEQCGHRCDCATPDCEHDADEAGRCTQILRWPARGEDASDGWQVYLIDPDGPPYISNIRILCTNCNQQAVTRIARIA